MAMVNSAQVQAFLAGVAYPAKREDLVDYARDGGADEDVISTLHALPDDDFQTPAQLNAAIDDLGIEPIDDAASVDPEDWDDETGDDDEDDDEEEE